MCVLVIIIIRGFQFRQILVFIIMLFDSNQRDQDNMQRASEGQRWADMVITTLPLSFLCLRDRGEYVMLTNLYGP